MVWQTFFSKDETDMTFKSTLEVDYDDTPPRLFIEIENKAWDRVTTFLETSSWPLTAAIFNDGYGPKRATRTWVTRYDEHEVDLPIWSKLPIHAAIAQGAPLRVVELLLKWFPESSRSVDDQGMFPIHLAMANGGSDQVIALLLKAYPEGIHQKCDEGLTPVDYAVKCEHEADRAFIFSSLISYTYVKNEVDKKKADLEQLKAKLDSKEREVKHLGNKYTHTRSYKKQMLKFTKEKDEIKKIITSKLAKKEETRKYYKEMLVELEAIDLEDINADFDLKELKQKARLFDTKYLIRKDIHALLKYIKREVKSESTHKKGQLEEISTLLVETDGILDNMDDQELDILVEKLNNVKRDLKQIDVERLKEKLKKQLVKKSGKEEKAWMRAISSIPDDRLSSMTYRQLKEIKGKAEGHLSGARSSSPMRFIRPSSPMRRFRSTVDSKSSKKNDSYSETTSISHCTQSSGKSNEENTCIIRNTPEGQQEAILEEPVASF